MEAVNMKSVNLCPACGKNEFKKKAVINKHNQKSFYSFSKLKYDGLLDSWLDDIQPEIVDCKACGHHWYIRQPSPDQLANMYNKGMHLLPGLISREPTREMLAHMQKLAELSGRDKPQLLDFGSGFGRWAKAAARVGFNVYAYEPSQVRSTKMETEFTLVNDIAQISGMKFDVINLEQVLEHVPTPLETLEHIKCYFSAHSVLRVRVPNILRPPEGKRLWHEWPYNGKRVHIMAPFEHLHGFTPGSLQKLASRAGFETITGLRLLRHYPFEWLRTCIKPLIPQWGSTFVLLRLPAQ
ncbi:MAG: class I SAM-dependent methyltransferase [Limnobacter sp.]|nr:class I SAM-dependent methyltransferase [Limnobacter sp.]